MWLSEICQIGRKIRQVLPFSVRMPCRPDMLLSWATLQHKIASLELTIQTIEPERDWIMALLMLPWLRGHLCELWTERLGHVLNWQTRLRPRH